MTSYDQIDRKSNHINILRRVKEKRQEKTSRSWQNLLQYIYKNKLGFSRGTHCSRESQLHFLTIDQEKSVYIQEGQVIFTFTGGVAIALELHTIDNRALTHPPTKRVLDKAVGLA